MKLNMIKAVALGACAFLTVGTASAETLRVGMECTYAPFNYRTADGELAGYDVDVAKGVAEIIGADLEFVCQEWAGMIPALLANKFDLVVASMSITEKRLEKIDFSIPYRDSIGRIIGKSSKDYKLFDETGVAIPANFSGLRVGLERASTYANWFEAKLPEAEVVFYDSSEAQYLDLRNGRVDLIMTNPMKAYLRFLSKDEGDGYGFASPAIDEVKYFGTGVGIAMRKDQPELKKRLDDALAQLIKTDKLTEYSLKIFPFPIYN
ncbi:MAG: transporter substrate-binding domain-containing protein [Halopseudomonas aestusnigri]